MGLFCDVIHSFVRHIPYVGHIGCMIPAVIVGEIRNYIHNHRFLVLYFVINKRLTATAFALPPDDTIFTEEQIVFMS